MPQLERCPEDRPDPAASRHDAVFGRVEENPLSENENLRPFPPRPSADSARTPLARLPARSRQGRVRTVTECPVASSVPAITGPTRSSRSPMTRKQIAHPVQSSLPIARRLLRVARHAPEPAPQSQIRDRGSSAASGGRRSAGDADRLLRHVPDIGRHPWCRAGAPVGADDPGTSPPVDHQDRVVDATDEAVLSAVDSGTAGIRGRGTHRPRSGRA